jgi:hypothetical protein
MAKQKYEPPKSPPTNCSDRCDTDAGYQRHNWHWEEPCGRSKRAHAALNAQRRRELVPPEPRTLAPHGSRGRYESERRAHNADPMNNPKPCQACTLANTARTAAARAKAAKAAG